MLIIVYDTLFELGLLNVSLLDQFEGEPAIALHTLLQQLPFADISTIVGTFLINIFFIISSDSGSLVDDMVTSGGDPNPPLAQKIFWAFSEGAVASTLLISGGPEGLRPASLTSGLPMGIILLVSAVGFYKALRNDNQIPDVPKRTELTKGSAMNAWGENASFQLAALHMLADVLPQAAEILGKEQDERWKEIDEKLPPYATVEGPLWLESNGMIQKRIGLWDGMDLITSHRHHSHLASIYPFVTIDPFSEDHHKIVESSLNFWTLRGPGAWSGWCVPWASVLNSRFDRTEAAVNWLHIWKETFTNAGRGTLHNAAFPGFSTIYHPVWEKYDGQNGEIMQLDAGFGAITAVTELLVQNRPDGIHVLPSLHRDWEELSFENLGAEGAFRISAKVEEGKVAEVKVKSMAGGALKLVHNLGEKWSMNGKEMSGSMLEKNCSVGEEIVLKKAKVGAKHYLQLWMRMLDICPT